MMTEPTKKCMVCGKSMTGPKASICQSCQDRIRREALGEQAAANERSERELAHHGIAPTKK
jgi:predicted nucleic acid-binding Zn ribbon protein